MIGLGLGLACISICIFCVFVFFFFILLYIYTCEYSIIKQYQSIIIRAIDRPTKGDEKHLEHCSNCYVRHTYIIKGMMKLCIVCMYICIVCMYICMYVCIYVCMYVCAICVYVCVCMYDIYLCMVF